MRQVYRIDKSGNYLEPVIIKDNEVLPDDCREDRPPNGFDKIKRNSTDTGWEEGSSEEEIDALKNTHQQLSDLEQLKKQQELMQVALDEIIFGGDF